MWIVIILGALALLHVYWAVGGRWPGHDDASLAARVVGGPAPLSSASMAGGPAPSAMPGFTACMAVAVALGLAAGFVGSALGAWGPLLSASLDWTAAVVVASAFGLRGAAGFFDAEFRPSIRSQPYYRLNLWLYSPLCLALAAGIAVGLT